jgi:phospholipid/cholesterol/gamma-HCH transport system substrate-binding protein
MKLSREVVVGLIFFAILVFLGFFTVYLSDFHFGRGQVLVVEFDQVKGLKEGDNVNVLGLRSGKVRDIEIDRDGAGVLVTLWIKEPIVLREDFEVQVTDSTLLGGKQVDIYPGARTKPPIDATAPLKGETTPELTRAIGSVVEENRDSLRAALRNLSEITADVRNARGLLGGLIYDEGLKRSAANILESVDRTTAQIASGRGSLGRFVYDEELHRRVDEIAANLESLSADVRAGRGIAGRLFTDEQMATDLRESVASLREIAGRLARGEGTMGRLLRDDQLHSNLVAIAEEVRSIVEKLNRGDGSLARLLSDGTLHEDLRQAVSDLRTIVADIRNGEGSLGKLLRRDDLYDEVSRVFQQIRGAIQDAREAAPITTFTAALFAIF